MSQAITYVVVGLWLVGWVAIAAYVHARPADRADRLDAAELFGLALLTGLPLLLMVRLALDSRVGPS